ncbi:MAG: response regulator transcription factor [Elusimicrobia bacterium]|nr:response regulator transcription factor [Elusimicrobiota bacterium]
MNPLRVLVVEDDPWNSDLIGTWLRDIPDPRFEPTPVASLAEARAALAEPSRFAAVLLDRSLGDGDGLDLLKHIRGRAATRDLPVIILSGRVLERDRIAGLDRGADEYLSKPCSEELLRAHLLAVLRSRARTAAADGRLQGPGFQLDPADGRLFVDGRVEHLEPKEAEILLVFLRRPSVVHSADFLRETVWGKAVLPHNTLETRLSSLRRKLGRRADRLETIRGSGYRLLP